MRKVKTLSILALSFLLVACNGASEVVSSDTNSSTSDTSTVVKDVIGDFLSKARDGFTLNAINVNDVFNKLTGEKLFTNITKYHGEYDNRDADRVIQSITKPVNGKDQTESVRFIKDKDGFLAKEFINYKNEPDMYRFGEEYGSAYIFDELFMNPFDFIFKEDFIKDENDENIYHLNPNKMAKFENYLIATGKPTASVDFDFEDEIPSIQIKSIELNGKAQLQDKTYVAAKWIFTTNITLDKLGTTVIEPIKVSEKEEISQLKTKLASVKDNYTLQSSLKVQGDDNESVTQVMKVTPNGVYIDVSNGQGDKSNNRLFKVDEFSDDNLYYEHVKQGTKWVKAPLTYPESYNIAPKGKEYFIPHMDEVYTGLFGYDSQTKSYKCDDANAVINVGNGFLADYNQVLYFNYGYGTAADIKMVGNSIQITLDFIANYNGAAYPMTYTLTYSNIGQTTIAELN